MRIVPLANENKVKWMESYVRHYIEEEEARGSVTIKKIMVEALDNGVLWAPD